MRCGELKDTGPWDVSVSSSVLKAGLCNLGFENGEALP